MSVTDRREFIRLDVPAPIYSRGRWLNDQRYVVGWPELGIIKVGSTHNGRARYGAFLSRGATLLDLANYRFGRSLDAEIWLEERLKSMYDPAFRSAAEAAPVLGKRGSGWTECVCAPVTDWPHIVALALEDAPETQEVAP